MLESDPKGGSFSLKYHLIHKGGAIILKKLNLNSSVIQLTDKRNEALTQLGVGKR